MRSFFVNKQSLIMLDLCAVSIFLVHFLLNSCIKIHFFIESVDKYAHNKSMSYKTIYHGSNKIIEKPIYHYGESNPHNDYGLGFYCTSNLDMAKEWSCITTTSGFANKYRIDDRGLKILNLCDKTKYTVLDWISILVHNRQFPQTFLEEYSEEIEFLEKRYQKIGIDNYDIIIGYRADDAYFRFPRMFIEGVLTYEKLEEIYLMGNLGKQYVLTHKRKGIFNDSLCWLYRIRGVL